MDNRAIANEITRVIWRVSPDELTGVLDSMGDRQVEETITGFRSGQDFFLTPAGRRFYKNGRMKKVRNG